MKKVMKAGLLLAVVCCLFCGIWMWDAATKGEAENSDVSQSDLGTVEFDGKKYRYNSNLVNVLFIGIDNNDILLEHDIPGTAGQSDCIMLLSMDKVTQKTRILQIPRDTMTEIDIYDGNGNRYDTRNGQIALQYAYGSGGENSSWAVKKTVSELLYELQIEGYLTLDVAAVNVVNDAIGGVTLTFKEDYTDIDPAFAEGVTLTLNGEQAHKFVRYRDTAIPFSNQDRMERQLQYMPELITAMKRYVNANQNYYDILLPLIEKYMLTDLQEDQIATFVDYDLAKAEIEYLPGEWVEGEAHDEYHVKDEELKKILIDRFYILENE